MAIARVNGQNVGANAHATSVSKAFPSNVTAGNFIAVAVTVYSATNTIANGQVTDNLGNTYTLRVVNNTGYGKVGIFEAHNITGGACTVTFTPTALDYIALGMCEYSGVDTTSPTDGTGATTYSTGTAASSGSFTTAGTDLLFGAISFYGQSPGTITNTGGYSLVDNEAANEPLNVEDQLNVAAGTQNATWTLQNSVGWSTVAIGFKAASGGNSYSVSASLSSTSIFSDAEIGNLLRGISLPSTSHFTDSQVGNLLRSVTLPSTSGFSPAQVGNLLRSISLSSVSALSIKTNTFFLPVSLSSTSGFVVAKSGTFQSGNMVDTFVTIFRRRR